MAKEIKQKIVLEGEQKYNQAIKEAQRNLKTLKSELKAETAELGKNATEQQKAEAKTKSLKQQIAEQEKIVKALKEALQEVKEKYGDNADEVAKWEQKLNGARTTLANMKTDLEGVGSGFKNVNTDAAAATVATKSVADALGSIGSTGESVSGAIEDIFTSLIDHVTDAVVQLWDLISETAAKANNWTDIANYWGTNAQTIQEYARAVQATGKNFEDLQSAVTKLVLGGKGKKITELIGVSDVNYKNDWDYAMAVMNRLYQMREKGENMTPIYEQIFGEKKSTKVMDLVKDWDEIQRLRTEFNGNETGYGMSDKELETMDQLWVKINTIEEKWNAIKDNVGAGFGEVSLDLLVSVEGTLNGIADYLNATNDSEKEAALQKIRANVEDFFMKLAGVIQESLHILRDVGEELQGSDDPLTSAIGDILVKLSSALQWMVDNQDKVKGAFEAIFGVWLIAKLGAVAGQLSSILMQIEAIKAFKGLGAAGGAAGAAGGSAGSGFFGGLFAKLFPWAFGAGLVVADSLNNHGNDDLVPVNEHGDAEWSNPSYDHDENGDTIIVASAYDEEGYIHIPGVGRKEIEEDVDLPETVYTEEEKEQALQDWWDARRNAEAGIDSREEATALEWFKETFGDEFGDAWDRIIQKLDEVEDETKLEDIPEDWWRTTGSWNAGGEDNGVTSDDLASFRSLPANMQAATQRGVAAGVKGIKVNLDGRAVGELVAPYVSQEIARDLTQ